MRPHERPFMTARIVKADIDISSENAFNVLIIERIATILKERY